MAKILIILPQDGFDPSEVALPWQVWQRAGHQVAFATETGVPATCDEITLTGKGLPWFARFLAARSEARKLYANVRERAEFRQPLRWDAVDPAAFDAFHFPGGHAAGVKSYLESPVVAGIAQAAFARAAPVSAICHGVLVLARAGVLAGRTTTALTGTMERIAVALTRWKLGTHYRTYPESVEEEVRRLIGRGGKFQRGPLARKFSGRTAQSVGFVVADGHYLSARWPGDAWTLALRLAKLL